MKRYFTAAVLAGAILLGGSAFASVTEVKEEKANWHLSYPVVSVDRNPSAQAAINEDIGALISELKQGYDTGKYDSVGGDYVVHYEDDVVLSMSLQLTGRPRGANGNHTRTISRVYDKETGARLPLSYFVHLTTEDLESYRQGHTYLMDGEEMPYERTFQEPIQSVPVNYFLPSGGAVCLVYQPYDLAPGVYGSLYIRLEPGYVDEMNRRNGI